MVLGVYAHVDAGKTTLSEQILLKGGVIRKLGSVNSGNTFMDHDSIEKKRGITIYTDEAKLKIAGYEYNLLDTPGHTDFAGEMERSIPAVDCAILLISAVDGIQSHTDTIRNLLKNNNVPTVIFLNKCDRDIAKPIKVIQNIKREWKVETIDFTKSNELTDDTRDIIVSENETLLTKYLNGEAEDNEIFESLCFSSKQHKIYPLICGAALQDKGIVALLKIVEKMNIAYKNCDDKFSGYVYKVKHESDGKRLTFVKIISGKLHAKDNVKIDSVYSEKINELRISSGGKYLDAKEVKAGQLCVLSGLTSPKAGTYIGSIKTKKQQMQFIPLLKSRVISNNENIAVSELIKNLRILEDEEPLLSVEYNNISNEITVCIMGEIQLEILQSNMKTNFGVDISFEEPSIIYMETIKNKVIGCGHFEPLRHYAEVRLMLEPAEQGSGITFESRCSSDILPESYQNLIKTHIYEKKHLGVLSASQLTDVKIVLLNGRAHNKHTEGGDFRQATYRAIRQGLMNAENIILEPWFEFITRTDISLAGRIYADVLQMNGNCDETKNEGDYVEIKGTCPVKNMRNYSKKFASFTKGKGRISMKLKGYYPCMNRDEVVQAISYDPEHDTQNPADSVFCSHGAGYTVKWYKVPEFMHTS